MEGMKGMLPGGYWDSAGVLHREFELFALTGRDEELLAQVNPAETASLVSAVLSRAVRRMGDVSPVSEDVARQLLVGDRQYLLLKLRQYTFGNLVRADLFCPWADCGRRVSMDFKIDELPVGEAAERAPFHSMTLSPEALGKDADAAQREVRFRLPNGGDQEAVAPLLEKNEAEALSLLLSRTIQRIGPVSSPGLEQVAMLPSAARAEIEAAMEGLAPKVELNLETVCPECGRSFLVPFNLQRFFFGELRTDLDLLYRQVHFLAYHYHWGEREIMAMARTQRHTYIELLTDEIERLNHDA